MAEYVYSVDQRPVSCWKLRITLPGGGGGVMTADWLGEEDDSDEAVVDDEDDDVPGRPTACGECINARLA